MKPNRLATLFALLVLPLFLSGATIEELKAELSHQKGEERIKTRGKIFQKSQDECDLAEQWRYLNDLLEETQRQHNKKEEADARVFRIVLAYNNDLNDSVYKYAPDDMAFIRNAEELEKFYEVWNLLVNTYVYDSHMTTGLEEAQKMLDDAVERKHDSGIGMAYYAMGNAYVGMGSMDIAGNCYEKSIDLLMKEDPPAGQLGELFSSLCEVYERTGEYDKMDRMLPRWKSYIERAIEDIKKQKLQNISVLNPLWAYYYIGCAQADIGTERIDHAGEMLEEARKYIPADDYYLFRTWLFYQTRLSFNRGDYSVALARSDQQLKLFDGTSETADYIRTLKQRALILTALQRHKEAASLYNEMYTLTDSVNGFEVKKQLAEMDTRMKVREIRMDEERQRARQTLVSLIAIATLIVASLVVFIYFRHRAAKRLRAAHSKLEETHSQLLIAYDQLEETTAAKERIESELRIARDIQMGMVPQTFPPFPERKDIDLYANMQPAKEVGGDLYDFILLGEKLYFCLGDVSGKGVPASLFMAQATRLFRALAKQQMMPAEIATRMNTELSENNENGMFVTMFLGEADLTTGHLNFCNAGHNPPVLKDRQDEAHFLEMLPNAPLGLWPGLDYEGEEIDDISGKPLFVYSDGLNEAMNTEQVEFGDDHLLEILQHLDFECAEATVTLMNEEVARHVRDAEQSDDLTMLCISIAGNQQSTVTNNS